MDQPKPPLEYPQHWYDEFLDGPLKERQERFLWRYGFAHNDKDIVHKQIVHMFEVTAAGHDGTYDGLIHFHLGDGSLVEIPTVLVLALMLHEGFGRDQGGRDRTMVEAKDRTIVDGKVYTMRKEEFDFILSCTRQQVRDPKFLASHKNLTTKKTIRGKAATDVLKREWPNLTEDEVFVWVQHIISPEVWSPRHRPGRIKKKKPVAM